jgi:hypothetical protein
MNLRFPILRSAAPAERVLMRKVGLRAVAQSILRNHLTVARWAPHVFTAPKQGVSEADRYPAAARADLTFDERFGHAVLSHVQL